MTLSDDQIRRRFESLPKQAHGGISLEAAIVIARSLVETARLDGPAAVVAPISRAAKLHRDVHQALVMVLAHVDAAHTAADWTRIRTAFKSIDRTVGRLVVLLSEESDR